MKKKAFFFLFFLVVFELGLRGIGIYEVYTEKLGEKYRSYWGFEHKGHYKILAKNQKVEFEQKEFKVSYTTNKFGMRNAEIDLEPQDSTIRILCLGDSFTQGDGATSDNSFPRELERILQLNHTNKKFEVINAGNNGSDLLYCERLYIDIAYQLKPYLVLFVTNDSDIEDIIQRGGTERFKANNATQFKKGPRYEPIYAKSHVFRFIIHGPLRKSNLFLSPKAEKNAIEAANKEVVESMKRIMKFSEDKDIQVRFVIHPYPAFAKLNKPIDKIPFKLNIENYLVASNESNLIYNLNEELLDTLHRLPYKSFAWPLNGHFNDNGYKIMAEEIHSEMLKDSILPIH